MWRQADAHGILKNVIAMCFVVRRIADAMIGRLGLPDSAQPQFTQHISRIRAATPEGWQSLAQARKPWEK